MTTITFQALYALKNGQPKKAQQILNEFFERNYYPNTLKTAEEFLDKEPEFPDGYLNTLFSDDEKWLEEYELE